MSRSFIWDSNRDDTRIPDPTHFEMGMTSGYTSGYTVACKVFIPP